MVKFINKINFSFSDLIAGYTTKIDKQIGSFIIKTSAGNEYEVKLKNNTTAQMVRNLGDPYIDCTQRIWEFLLPNNFLFAYCIFYPEKEGYVIEAQSLIFLETSPGEFVFTKHEWWKRQVQEIADFYLLAEFGGQEIDYHNYRTNLNLSGEKLKENFRQETATISRFISGMGLAYLITGEDRFIDAAEKGVEYLHQHMRFYDAEENIVYWYHGIDVQGAHEEKLLASEFGDDYHAIAAYEQIYALGGQTITYRVNLDPKIREDIELTLKLFEKFYLDKEKGGYFTHLDPLTLDPHSDFLGDKKSKKNWNSIGDHLPVYAAHLWLATGDENHAKLIESRADLLVKYFTDFQNSPFVLERFNEDWSPDFSHFWQQNRGVVGHNLKIAWNMMRINSLIPKAEYVELAKKIADLMPKIGLDTLRCGWYDVMERNLKEGETIYRFSFHNRKAWWQQEQCILAYLILAGVLGDENYRRLAFESSAYYNAFFLDHQDNGVFFNTLAAGHPYLMDTERTKGSHAMSGCHSIELAFLAQVYLNLLILNNPLDLYFKPYVDTLKDNTLRVSPDMLPAGRVYISDVWVNGQPYSDFDPKAHTVHLPGLKDRVKVKVRYKSYPL